mmetsp:Transcript_7778/g.15636  ORF Transcript_7778/g.15636 Transcript_7778/m.15636 type:complete len:291 (+) Transcript_7778:542-1414(+)
MPSQSRILMPSSLWRTTRGEGNRKFGREQCHFLLIRYNHSFVKDFVNALLTLLYSVVMLSLNSTDATPTPRREAIIKSSASHTGMIPLFFCFCARFFSTFSLSARSFFCCWRHCSIVSPVELFAGLDGMTTWGGVNGFCGVTTFGGAGGGGGVTTFGGEGRGEDGGGGGMTALGGGGGEGDGGATGFFSSSALPPNENDGILSNDGAEKEGNDEPSFPLSDLSSSFRAGACGIDGTEGAVDGLYTDGGEGVASTDAALCSAFSLNDLNISFLLSVSNLRLSYGDRSSSPA